MKALNNAICNNVTGLFLPLPVDPKSLNLSQKVSALRKPIDFTSSACHSTHTSTMKGVTGLC